MDSLHKVLLHKVLLHKVLLHKELLQTELFQKKLVLNGLNVPSEIISIIKDYTFMDTTMSKAKKNKNKLSHLITTTKWCGKKRPKDEDKGITVFWIEKDVRSPQFQMSFCKKCGDYQAHTQLQFEGQFDKVACRC
jgi:hypothetical protein